MNRILFEKGEISSGAAVFGGARAAHVAEVLHGEPGQILKTGEIDGRVGTSVIESVERTDGDDAEYRVTVRVTHGEDAPPSWCDIILAPPRPRVFKRLLPQLAAMGAGAIVLVGAKKVEKDFWGATILKEKNWRPLCVEGLMQAGTSEMPRIVLRRGFRAFLRDELDAMFPTANRVVAHPYAIAEGAESAPSASGRLLLAIGPEGGWDDGEVAALAGKGFRPYSLGKRILRTDTAAIALMSKLCNERQTTNERKSK